MLRRFIRQSNRCLSRMSSSSEIVFAVTMAPLSLGRTHSSPWRYPVHKRATWLLEYKRNVHSQTGEDGIIEAILPALGNLNNWCVEFGAWDGKHLSNARNLIDKGYSAVLIEADKNRFHDLQRTFRENTKVVTINAFVGFDNNSGLDFLLSQTGIPKEFDFCSIDIDGNDYYVWKAMETYRPKLVCIEFNPTIPTECSFVQPANPSTNQGASLLALVELGKDKGYELACALSHNAFFVRVDLFPLLDIQDNRPETLRTDLSFITHFFYGYDGRVFLRGNSYMPWHGLKINESRIQLLPNWLRTYPENYAQWQKILMRIYRRLR
jgi:hypothetical protein